MSGRPDQRRTAYRDPVFEGFAVQMVAPRQGRALRWLIARDLGRGWRARPFGDAPTHFEITSRRASPGVAGAWAATYRLRALPGVAYAEPVFTLVVSDRLDWREPPGSAPEGAQPEAELQELCFELAPLPESGDHEWSLREAGVLAAWQRFFPAPGESPGSDVVIGHPDTGYPRHAEILGNLRVEQGNDLVDDDPDATDELAGGMLRNPGHGTATASVIVIQPGVQTPIPAGARWPGWHPVPRSCRCGWHARSSWG